MKKSIKYILLAFLVVLAVSTVLFGCGKGEQTESTTTAPKVTSKPAPTTDYNRLTGIDDLSDEAKGKRPVAIMINNIKASLPQYGISAADLMFECPVEGGITRMMAVYADYTKVPSVCSVRSCRYYFPVMAQGLDAVYFCFGSNETLGTPMLKKLGIDYFNGAENYDTLVFGRDPNRLGKYKREHTAFVNGEKIPDLFSKYKTRTDYLSDKDDYIFSFRDQGKEKAPSSEKCNKVTLNFSNSYYSTFTYDSETKTYKKQHSGKPHMDSATGQQLAYTNVFALETTVNLYKGGPLVEFDWHSGTGYYISLGGVKKIKWSKKTAEDTIKITDENGKTVKVNAGKSYIGFVNNGSVKISENA